jgi:hypothetical protein
MFFHFPNLIFPNAPNRVIIKNQRGTFTLLYSRYGKAPITQIREAHVDNAGVHSYSRVIEKFAVFEYKNQITLIYYIFKLFLYGCLLMVTYTKIGNLPELTGNYKVNDPDPDPDSYRDYRDGEMIKITIGQEVIRNFLTGFYYIDNFIDTFFDIFFNFVFPKAQYFPSLIN